MWDRAGPVTRFRGGPGGQSFRGLQGQFGRPGHGYQFMPRTGRNGWFNRNGHWNNNHWNRHNNNWWRPYRHNFVNNNFWYPWYWSAPFWGDFGYPGYYPSIYSYWGWTPGWIEPNEGYYQPPYTYSEYPTYNYSYQTAPGHGRSGSGSASGRSCAGSADCC